MAKDRTRPASTGQTATDSTTTELGVTASEPPTTQVTICEDGKHDIHTSSNETHITESCRNCPWTHSKPRS